MSDAVGITPARAEEIDEASIITFKVEDDTYKAVNRGGVETDLIVGAIYKPIVRIASWVTGILDLVLPYWYLPFWPNVILEYDTSDPNALNGNATCVKFTADGFYALEGSTAAPYMSGSAARSNDPSDPSFWVYSDPSSSLTGPVRDAAFSPDSTRMVVVHDTSPYIQIRDIAVTEDGLGDPLESSYPLLDLFGNGSPILPTGNPSGPATAVDWSSDDKYLAVAQDSAPYLTIYKRSGDVFTKLPSVPNPPSSQTKGVSWSPDGKYLAVSCISAPYILLYERVGDSLVQLSSPAILPTGAGRKLEWSNSGLYLSIAHTTSPFVTVYKHNAGVLTKLANPATLPTGEGTDVAWYPDDSFMAVSHDVTPFITVYKRDGDVFLKLPNLQTLPTGKANGVDWSPHGDFMAVAHNTTPFMSIYYRADNRYGGAPKLVP